MKVGWNTPAWSLSCEFFFYLCFPLLFLWLRNTKRSQMAIAIALALSVPILLEHAKVPPYWKPLHHLADFVMGIAAAQIYGKIVGTWRGKGYWFYVPAALAGAAFLVHPESLYGTPVDLNTVLRPLNAAALIGFGLGGGWAARALAYRAAEYLGKIEVMGGMQKAIERGFVQQEIQNAAYEYQQAVDRGDAVVVGVNRFEVEAEKAIPIQKIDPALEPKQIERLRALRARRDAAPWKSAVAAVEDAARTGANVMPRIVEAVEAYATVGEISDAMRRVFGEYREAVVI